LEINYDILRMGHGSNTEAALGLRSNKALPGWALKNMGHRVVGVTWGTFSALTLCVPELSNELLRV